MCDTAMKIEDASIRHLDRLYEIERECFKKEAFAKKQIAQLLTDYNSIGLIAEDNDKIEGFIIGALCFERTALSGHILTLDVSLSHRRQGIGERLLLGIERVFKEKGAKTCHLEVREDNDTALGLYEKLGYKKIGKLENYYGKAHGVYLAKTLT
jgi:ribosomal-protein-alanine N-acetyltransferase